MVPSLNNLAPRNNFVALLTTKSMQVSSRGDDHRDSTAKFATMISFGFHFIPLIGKDVISFTDVCTIPTNGINMIIDMGHSKFFSIHNQWGFSSYYPGRKVDMNAITSTFCSFLLYSVHQEREIFVLSVSTDYKYFIFCNLHDL